MKTDLERLIDFLHQADIAFGVYVYFDDDKVDVYHGDTWLEDGEEGFSLAYNYSGLIYASKKDGGYSGFFTEYTFESEKLTGYGAWK